MACCCSSPYSARRYPYPEDDHLEEENVPIRTFGKYRSGSVLVPDDIGGFTFHQALGCRRVFGRKGLFFCTEGSSDCCWLRHKKPGDPPPPLEHRDLDNDNDASVVLRKVHEVGTLKVALTSKWEAIHHQQMKSTRR
jgi:hypothetical protein